MEEKLNSLNQENIEQFETSEIIDSRKKHHNKKLFSINQLIKYTLLTFVILCLFLLLFNLTNQNSQNFPNKIESPLEQKPFTKKCEVGYKNEGDKCVLDYAIKITYITKNDNENINLIGFIPDFPLRMTIDGKIVESTKTFTFPQKGEHTVLIKSNFTKLTSAKRMFYKIIHAVKIEFTPLFDFKRYESNVL